MDLFDRFIEKLAAKRTSHLRKFLQQQEQIVADGEITPNPNQADLMNTNSLKSVGIGGVQPLPTHPWNSSII